MSDTKVDAVRHTMRAWTLGGWMCLVGSLAQAGTMSGPEAGLHPSLISYLDYLSPRLQEIHVALEMWKPHQWQPQLQAELDSLALAGMSGSMDYADVLDLLVLARVKTDEMNRIETLELAQTAYDLRSRLSSPTDLLRAASAYNLGAALTMQSRGAEALDYLRESLALRTRSLSTPHPALAFSWRGIGNAYCLIGMDAASLRAFERALAEFLACDGWRGLYSAGVRSSIASVHEHIGLFKSANRQMKRSHEDLTSILTPPNLRLVISAYELAEVGVLSGSLDRVDQLLAEASQQLSELEFEQPRLSGLLHITAAANAVLNRDVEAAQASVARALRSELKLGGRKSAAWAAYTVGEAATYAMLGEYENAKDRIVASAAVLDSLSTVHPRVAAHVLDSRAIIESALGHADVALNYALQADQVVGSHARSEVALFREAEALIASSRRLVPLSTAISILLKHTLMDAPTLSRVWNSVADARAQTTEILRTRMSAYLERRDEEAAALLDEYGAIQTQLSKLVLQSVPEERASGVSKLQRRKAELERDLLMRNVSLEHWTRVASKEPESLDVGALAESLPAATTLVSFLRYDRVLERTQAAATPEAEARMWSGTELGILLRPAFVLPSYAAFVLPAGSSSPLLMDLGPAHEIEDAVSAWREILVQSGAGATRLGGEADQGEGLSTASRQLRRLIWDPIVSELGDVEQVFLIPDGAIHFVNFDALEQEDGRFLAESMPLFHSLTSERALVDLIDRPRSDPQPSVLIVAGPNYTNAVAEAGLDQGAQRSYAVGTYRGFSGVAVGVEPTRREPFHALPGAMREGQDLARLWRDRRGEAARVTLLSGSEASESRFVDEAPGYSVIHLATHAFFKSLTSTPQSPLSGMLNSAGIALAHPVLNGASPERDGLLFAEEISRLDLSRADWVVLSACESGLGEVQASEGVRGLREGFEAAGARSLILSLWKVLDEPTREWMLELYEARLDGSSTAESVRTANLRILERRRQRGVSTSPFYWGAFVATGDWR